METATNSIYGQALDLISLLPLEEQEDLVETVRRRMLEQRRAEIARNAAAALQDIHDIHEGPGSAGTADDFKREFLAEL